MAERIFILFFLFGGDFQQSMFDNIQRGDEDGDDDLFPLVLLLTVTEIQGFYKRMFWHVVEGMQPNVLGW